jgi:signal transduction histidine kinase
MPLTLVSALRGRPGHVPVGFGGAPSDVDSVSLSEVAGTTDAPLAAWPVNGLGEVAARSAAVLRLAWCVVALVVAYGSGPVAAPSYWRDALIFGALAWGVITAGVCWRGHLPPWLIIGDVAVCSGLLIAMVRLLPVVEVGAAGSWVLGWAGVSVLLAAWRLRASQVWLVTFVEIAAYLLGSRVAGVHGHSTEPFGLAKGITATAQAVGMLLALTAIGLVLVRLVRLGAADANRTLNAWNAARQRNDVEEARLHDRSARRLLLHDTVLTTLTAIARGGLRGRAELVRDRCGNDLDALRRDPDAAEPIRTAEQLLAVARRQALHRGLDVFVSGEPPTNRLPAEVAAAFGAAMREALSNIEKHAGTTEVRIGVRGNDDYLEIVVQDAGRGFDSANARTGLGLPRSLTGRMHAVGGSASVESSPNRGTTVTLRWTAEAHEAAAARTQSATMAASALRTAPAPLLAGPTVARAADEHMVADRYTRYALLALAWIGHFWQALSLALLIANWSEYRSGPIALAGWAVLFVITLVQVYLATFQGNRDWIDRNAVWMAPLATLAALTILADCTPHGLLTPANWPIAVLGWILAVFAVHQARWFDVSWLALAVVMLIAVWATGDGGGHDLAIGLGVVFGAGIPQVGALAVILELRQHAGVTTQAIGHQHQLLAANASREAVTADRAARDAALNRDLIPLLMSLATGAVDPDDDYERRRCELAAAEVRALVDHDDLTTPIATLDAVAAVTRSARTRDVVPVVEIGDGLDALSDGWQQTFTRLADRLLAEALPGEATLTVRGESDAIAVTLCFPTRTPAPELESVAVGAGRALVPDRAVRVDVEPDTTNIAWLEVTWETRTVA